MLDSAKKYFHSRTGPLEYMKNVRHRAGIAAVEGAVGEADQSAGSAIKTVVGNLTAAATDTQFLRAAGMRPRR